MFFIYIDRLKDGKEVEIQESHPPAFLDIDNDKEIRPQSDVQLCGKAYLAGDWLVIEGQIKTHLALFCSVCNDLFSYPIVIEQWIHEEPVENIHSGIFSYCDLVREAILVEVPFFTQCGGFECKNIDEMKKYMTTTSSQSCEHRHTNIDRTSDKEKKRIEENGSDIDGYQPFKDFKWDIDQ